DRVCKEGPRVRARRAAVRRWTFLTDFGTANLQHRAFGARRTAGRDSSDDAQVGGAHVLEFDLYVRHACSERRVLIQRLAVLALSGGNVFEFGQGCRRLADTRDVGALVGQKVLGAGPAAVLYPDEVLNRHANIREEHFVYFVFAVERDDGAHLDARAVHVDQQET